MKNILNTFNCLLLTALSLVVITSCSDEDYEVQPGENESSVTGVIKSDPNYTLLVSALTQAELIRPLNDAGPFTIFAPTNAALGAAGISNTTIDTANTFTGKNFLMGVLTYHMVGGLELTGVGDTDSSSTKFSTLNGTPFFVTESTRGMVVNTANVTEAKTALNGTTYAIDKFLQVPEGNIMAFINGNPNLSLLAAALDSVDLETDLNSTTIGYNIFAPTNEAFINAGIPDVNAIGALGKDVLRNILLYHVTPRVYFPENLTDRTVRTLKGKNDRLALTAQGAFTVTDETGETATVTQSNIITTNGVIHVIDKILTSN